MLKKTKYLILLGLLFSVFPDTYIWAMDITGSYNGYYQYYDRNRSNIIGHFSITIEQQDKRIKGVIKEPRTTFGPNKPFLYADIEGGITGSSDNFSIRFIKKYRYSGHTVNYAGTYKSFLGQVEGEWNIKNYRGNFQISNIQPVSEIDFEPPTIMLLRPGLVVSGKNARGLTRVSVPAEGSIKITGLASDNIKVDRVLINGIQASLTAPEYREQNMIQGQAVKFSMTLKAQKDEQMIIHAYDLDNNQATLKLKPDVSPNFADKPNGQKVGRKVAVVIGINQYQQWPPLEFAVNDAESVKQSLKDQHGFDTVISLTNQEATRTNILKLLGYKLRQITSPEDSVIIYFAGHGHTESLEDGGKDGYIMPVDAGLEDSFLSGISMRQLRSVSRRIKAKHVLFVMDSCYSGLGFTRSAGVASNETDYIKKIQAYRVVQMITAGGENEQVQEAGGHGLFTRHFLKGINGKADSNNDGYITGSELGLWLRREVTMASGARQTPNFGRFEDEGDFIFRSLH